MRSARLAALLLLLTTAVAASARISAKPRPLEPPGLKHLDAVVERSIADDELPGAVVLVWHKGRVVYRKAYGDRALVPAREPMTMDTIFDLASLTKVVATAPSVLKLVEEGRIRLNDPVARYLPEFGTDGKENITVRQLLTHFSGLRPDLSLDQPWSGYETAIQKAFAETPVVAPGTRFIYSDINFIVLGELVHRVSGQPLDEFARKNIFSPLGMKDTGFRPLAALRARIAPTEERGGRILRGEVHDPTAERMGGVAGHAGLFSTADDLARFAEMFLSGGRYRGHRILSPLAIAKMTSPQAPSWSAIERGLGWDLDSPFSANRGDLLPIGSYGHTGFTGTSLWIDPVSSTFIILLANSVHPKVRPPLSSLRARVADIVAASLPAVAQEHILSPGARLTGWVERAGGAASARNGEVKAGIDRLIEEKFTGLVGKRLGLITNQTGLTLKGGRTIDVLFHAPGVRLVKIFSPEHGPTGTAEGKVASSSDANTGLPIASLYGETRRPTAEMLEGLDALVFDIQDAGVRYYTYITTMAYAMEEAAKLKIAFYVLDRPNPLGGVAVEGPILDRDRLSFVGYFPLPLRYGMTLGELAQMFNTENKIGVDLHIIMMVGWRRSDWYDSTGLLWVNPSPNLRSLNAAITYAAVELLRSAGVSVGRGTDAPFEQFGAPWIDPVKLSDYLNRRNLPGIRFYPVEFTPTADLYPNEPCHGVRLIVVDRNHLDVGWLGVELVTALARFWPQHFTIEKTMTLLGSRATMEELKSGVDPERIAESWFVDLEQFRKLREKYLLYQ